MSLQWSSQYAGRRTLQQAAHDSGKAGEHPARQAPRLCYMSTISIWEFFIPVSGLHVNWELGSHLGKLCHRIQVQQTSTRVGSWGPRMPYCISLTADHQLVQNRSKSLCVSNGMMFADFILKDICFSLGVLICNDCDRLDYWSAHIPYLSCYLHGKHILSCPSNVGLGHVTWYVQRMWKADRQLPCLVLTFQTWCLKRHHMFPLSVWHMYCCHEKHVSWVACWSQNERYMGQTWTWPMGPMTWGQAQPAPAWISPTLGMWVRN